jgi:hypothetical protein
MVISNQNRASYFSVKLEYSNIQFGNVNLHDKVSDQMDLVLNSLQVSDEIYKFNYSNCVIYLFTTDKRKRRGQVTKFIEKYLDNIVEKSSVIALMKKEFYSCAEKLKSNKNTIKTQEPDQFGEYTASDVAILEDRANWHDWQRDLYSRIFYQTGEVRKPHDRKIMFLYDPVGNNGKSTFFKWLYWRNSQSIGHISVGTASQLRSSVCKVPHKSIYLCDIPRSLGSQDQYRIADLMAVVEEIKSGLLLDMMYGSHNLLLMNTPHVIVSSNFLINPDSLSKDRWEILKITKDLKLVDITTETKKKFKQEKKNTMYV